MNSELQKKIYFLIIIFIFSLFELPAQWIKINTGTTSSLTSIHFADQNAGYAVGEAGVILKSTNGGETWQNVSAPGSTNFNDVFVFNQDNVIVVGGSGSIIKTTNGGLSWSVIPTSVFDELYSVSFVDAFGICGGSSQTILYSTNSGDSWSVSQSGFFGGGFWGASMISSQIGFVAGQNSIFQPLLGKTTNSGLNWDFTPFYLNSNEGRATSVIFTDANIGYVSSAVWDGRGAVSKTTDSGSNWTTTFTTYPLNDINFPISGASLTGFAAGNAGTILRTNDAGNNWQLQQTGTLQNINKIYFLDFDFGFAAADSGIILKTINGGVPVELISFTAAKAGNSVHLKWSTATETNNKGFEVERKAQDAESMAWGKIGFVEGSGTSTEVQNYSFEDKNLSAGKYFYRLKQIDFDGTFEYLKEAEANVAAPGEFVLYQNYPNPFNPVTNFGVRISNSGFVSLKVYDILGNEIAVIVNEVKEAGEYEFEWNALGLNSGVYFYQLQTNSFSDTKKLLLLK